MITSAVGPCHRQTAQQALLSDVLSPMQTRVLMCLPLSCQSGQGALRRTGIYALQPSGN